jgi:hypothetical protein
LCGTYGGLNLGDEAILTAAIEQLRPAVPGVRLTLRHELFAIFAALAGVPVLALPYAAKVTAFIDRRGLPTLPLVQQEHAGALLGAIDPRPDTLRESAAGSRQRQPALPPECLCTRCSASF